MMQPISGAIDVLRLTKFELRKAAVTLILFAIAGVTFFPMFVLLLLPFKSGVELLMDPLSLPENYSFETYRMVWFESGFQQYFLNSVIVVGVSLIVIVATASLAAFALVQYEFSAKKILLAFLIGGLLIPTQVLIVPLYGIMNELELLNTYYSLVLAYVAFAVPFSVFLVRQFFVGIPDSFAEAARMDGCSELQVFSRIYLPLAAPALAALAIYQFVFVWNEFLFAITFITEDATRTLPAGLMIFQGERGANAWPLLFAGVVIAVVPTMLFLAVFQRHFVRGVTMGLGKG